MLNSKVQIIAKTENKDIATVYIANLNGKNIEFVESLQPPIPIEKKWVLIISSLFGCPVDCKICDAGGNYSGKMSKDEILAQIDWLVLNRWGEFAIPSEKFKIQFARVGEPAFNISVLDALEVLPSRYNAPGLLPSISTIAPNGTDAFFDRLPDIKNKYYAKSFQMQFSIHHTDRKTRDELIPIKKWDFDKINKYSESFFSKGERKITLNFAISDLAAINPVILSDYFNPDIFVIKITPVNPTQKAIRNNMASTPDYFSLKQELIPDLNKRGFATILSIGELEENHIGSNCGQYISAINKAELNRTDTYTYQTEKFIK